MANRYYIINKPQGMVSQFTGERSVAMLGELGHNFPEGTHAVGRLDSLSEGLLILTTNKRVTKLLFEGETPHRRTYLVRVKNKVSPERLHQLRAGVSIQIRDDEFYTTPPCDVEIIAQPESLFPHQLELREQVSHTWLQISLYEGKYHQIRKMVSAVHHRCLRLIRISIEDLALGALAPGEVKEIEEADFFERLKIDDWKQPDK